MKEPEEIMSLHLELIASTVYVFPQKGKVNLSEKHGVYIIYNPKSEVLHVGTTKYGKGGLNQRLTNHISKQGIFYREYLKPQKIEMKGKYKFKYIEVTSARTRALLEALTAGLLCPKYIGTGERNTKQ